MTTGLDEQRTILRYKVPRKCTQYVIVQQRPNYDVENFCRRCSIKYPKNIVRCLSCKYLIRSKPKIGSRRERFNFKRY